MHLVKVSGFSSFSKVVRIAFLIMIAPVGEVVYYFLVYRRTALTCSENSVQNRV